MTTTKKTIPMSEQRPVEIYPEDWPVIAEAMKHDGNVACQANTEWLIHVREHMDGRRLVYGYCRAGRGGKPAGWRGAHAGFLIDSCVRLLAPRDVDDETIRCIRRVDGVIGGNLANDCIADLPAVELV